MLHFISDNLRINSRITTAFMSKTRQIKLDLPVNPDVRVEDGTSGVPVSKFIEIMQMNKMMQF